MTGPRWQRRPDQRADELLDAAEQRFVEVGVEATTVSDIVTAAGVAKGSFYRYFASKNQLVAALKTRFMNRLPDEVTAAIAEADPEDWGARADVVVARTVDFLLGHAELLDVWCRETHPHAADDAFSVGVERLAELYEAGIRAGIEAGALHCAHPRATALLLIHAVDGAVEHHVLYGRLERDELVAAAQALVRATLGLPTMTTRPDDGTGSVVASNRSRVVGTV